MIVWSLAAQCHLAEARTLKSQVSSPTVGIRHVWNVKQRPTDRAESIEKTLAGFSISESSRQQTAVAWRDIDGVFRQQSGTNPMRTRKRRFFPGYRSESDLSWEEMAQFGSGGARPNTESDTEE